MSYIKYLVLIIFSVILTVIITIVDAILRNQLVAGKAGLPLRFSDMSLFGGGETNYLYLALDIIFWFCIILIFFKYLPKLFTKSKN